MASSGWRTRGRAAGALLLGFRRKTVPLPDLAERRAELLTVIASTLSVSSARAFEHLGLVRADQHEGDATGDLAVVHPRMIGALLNQNIASLEMDFAVVEQHVDLSLQHDRVVDALGAMHERMIGVLALAPLLGADPHLRREGGVVDLDLPCHRREVHNPQNRPIHRRRNPDGALSLILAAGNVRWGLIGYPQQRRRHPRCARDRILGAVVNHDGSAVLVVSCDDPPDWLAHADSGCYSRGCLSAPDDL